jgi:disulfide bond formation protein DsbB
MLWLKNFLYKDYRRILQITMICCCIGLCAMKFIEVFIGFPPCVMCKIQRFLYIIVVIIIWASLLIERMGKFRKNFNPNLVFKIYKIVFFTTVIIVLISSLFLVYQIMVEYKILEIPSFCKQGISPSANSQEVMEILNKPNLTPSCGIRFLLFGFSIAEWSFLLSTMLILYLIFGWKVMKK